MSDFLTHLAARSLDLPPAVQPRPTPLFEPPSPLDGAPDLEERRFQETEEAGAALPESHPVPSPRRGAPPFSTSESAEPSILFPSPGRSRGEESAETPSGTPRASRAEDHPIRPEAPLMAPRLPGSPLRPPATPADFTTPVPVEARQTPAPPDLASALPRRPEPAPAAEPIVTMRVERIALPAEVRPLVPLPRPAPPVAAPVRPGRETVPGIERVIVEREVAMALPASPPSVRAAAEPLLARLDTVAPPPASGLLSPRIEPAFPAMPPPLVSTGSGAAPAIHVTIGRIEVRATPPPSASSPARRRASGPPAMSLQDYLRQRDGRGGR